MSTPARAAIQSQRMEMIGRLSSSVIHDLNNLLTVIQLNSAVIEGGGLSEEEIRSGAEQIGLACKQASHLTRKVLNLARRRSEEDSPVAVDALVADLGRLFEAFVAKKASIRVEVESVPLWVHGNASEIEQMLMNLVLNAVDAMPDGGDVVIGCRPIAGGGGSPQVEISVRDGGGGIPAGVRNRILEPFFTTKEGEGGTGMGLYIVDQIVQRHGGALDFDSEPGRGTVVRVRLPARPDSPVGAPEPPPSPRGAQRGMILLVEDDAGIRQLMRHLLVRAGYVVLEAGTGEEALDVWAANRAEVQLLLTDLVLPGELSGRDVVLTALSQRPDLPVLYTSGYATAWDDQAFFNEAHFIPKPFHPDVLLAKVAASLAGAG